jgi:hypothetical protein
MAEEPYADMDESGEPVEMLARFCDAHDWSHDRVSDEEVVATVAGSWSNYELRGVWRDEDQVLQILVIPELTIDASKRPAIWEMLALINERMWLGHVELWSQSGMLLYRNSVLVDGEGISFGALEVLIHTAIDEMDRFYPAFQFVLWGGKTPSEAIAAALIETRGEA